VNLRAIQSGTITPFSPDEDLALRLAEFDGNCPAWADFVQARLDRARYNPRPEKVYSMRIRKLKASCRKCGASFISQYAGIEYLDRCDIALRTTLCAACL
jgi:hypothetical protein